MRWFSIAVLAYMILGITWWGMLLYSKNGELYQEKLRTTPSSQVGTIEAERDRQNLMIVGEGIVLGLSLLAGIYIINRSASREIKAAKQQSNFLLSVSHELKSPIAAIKLALETMTRPKLPPESVASISRTAVKDADRLEKLVQNILLSASIEDSQLELYKEETDIAAMVSKTALRYQNNSKGLHVEVHGTDQTILASIDRLNINQALSNILDNAIKYAEGNTPIKITLSKNSERISIDIVNIGSQINEQEKDVIFRKFYRGQDQDVRRQEGTGIGLYIAKQIVDAHNGSITAQNIADQRVCFSIHLPLGE